MKKINGINVEIIWGQIIALKADAYVVPQYSDRLSDTPMVREMMNHHTQPAFKVFRRCIAAQTLEMCTAVSGFCTGGSCRMLIHSVILDDEADNLSSDVEDAVLRILTLSNALGVQSLAMPLLGYGEFGSLSATEAAKAVLSGIDCCNSHSTVKEIKIVIPDSPGAADEVERVLQNDDYLGDFPW